MTAPAESAPTAFVAWKLFTNTEPRRHVDTVRYPPTYDARAVADAEYAKREIGIVAICAAPVVGMLATQHVGSDDYPYTVTSVSASGAVITLQARRSRGPLTIENPQGETITARRRTDGSFRTSGRHGCRISFGEATSYSDPSF